MSLLNKMSAVQKISSVVAKKVTITGKVRVPMTTEQVVEAKANIIKNNLGRSVAPNTFDVAVPFRVAVYNKGDQEFNNYGIYESADVAAAIGTIVSVGHFGERATAGTYDESVVEASAAYQAFLSDPQNADIIARASGDKLCITAEQRQAKAA